MNKDPTEAVCDLALDPGFQGCIKEQATVEEATKIIGYISHNVFAKWWVLSLVVKRHEERIRQRWAKKTREQRKKLLRNIWPEINTHHRPDFRHFLQEVRSDSVFLGPKRSAAYSFPTLNLEDLAEGKTLPLFLNSRGRHHPSKFTGIDIQSIPLITNPQVSRMPVLNASGAHITVGLHVQTDPESYGALVSWETSDGAPESIERGTHEPYERGYYVLLIQQQILWFLVRSCVSILQTALPELIAGDVKPEPPPIRLDPSARPSVALMIAEAPYRVPPQYMDVERLLAIIAAKRSGALDHIFNLREDPRYFADTVKDYADHRPESYSYLQSTSTPASGPRIWDLALQDTCESAYFSAIHWDATHRQITAVAQLLDRDPKPFAHEEKPPTDLSYAIGHLARYLSRMVGQLICELRFHLPSSPPMRSQCAKYFPKQHYFSCDCCERQSKSALRPGHILWIFELMMSRETVENFGLSNMLDEIERDLRQDPKQNDLIAPFIDHILSDLAVVAECQRQLEAMPWYRIATKTAGERDEQIEDAISALQSDLQSLCDQIRKIEMYELGCPSNQYFHFPVDKRRSQQTSDQMRLAEARLDAFWDMFDGKLSKDTRDRIAAFSPMRHQLERTPEWQELEVPQEPQQSAHGTLQKRNECQVSFPAIRHVESNSGKNANRPRGNSSHQPPSDGKVKTRGTPSAPAHSSEATSSPDSPPVPLAPCPRIAVSRRALRVFDFLLRTTSDGTWSAPRGEIPWTDFLHAMARAGFALEKMHGSAWQFTRDKGAVSASGRDGDARSRGSIQFHEPHPRSKIRSVDGRRMGRRLRRAFGWDGDTFVAQR